MSKKPILYKGIIPFPLGLPMVRYPRRNNAYYLINFRKWDWWGRCQVLHHVRDFFYYHEKRNPEDQYSL